MSNTAYHINSLTKKALALSREEWQSVIDIVIAKDVNISFKLIDVKVSVDLIRKELDFAEQAEEAAANLEGKTTA